MQLKLFAFLALFISVSAKAQFVYKFNTEVNHGGNILDFAFDGGLNSPQWSSVDANNDGNLDLFVFDRTNETIKIYACDAAGNLTGRIENQEEAFPFLTDWVLLKDFNCDNLPDVFCYGNGGIKVFKNIGSITQWQFVLETEEILTFSDFGTNSYFSNLYVSTVDLPIIDDLDNDGDLDILTFDLNGQNINYHKNMSVEYNGNCDSLQFVLKNKCWGYIKEAEFDNAITTGVEECPFNVVNPERRFYPKQENYPTKHLTSNRHAGSSLTNVSNGNTLTDILIGDVSYASLHHLSVVKDNNGRDSVANVNLNYPSNSPVNLELFPAAYYLKRGAPSNTNELLVSPYALSGSANQSSVWRYNNNQLQSKSFLQNEMIDVGSDAVPVWQDMNRDGNMDIIIGSGNTFISENNYASLTVYLNTGSNNNPAFQLSTTDFLNLQSEHYENLLPTFGDLNGDNRDDLILGTKNGTLLYYINRQESSENYTLNTALLKDNENNTIDVGFLAAPCLVDVNNDNLTDLLIGCRTGTIYYYKNVGSTNSPSFELVTNNYAGINVTPGLELNGFSTPSVFEWDNQTFLVVGNITGETHWYSNLSHTDATIYNEFPNNFKTGRKGSATIFEINDVLQVMLGNKAGGISFYNVDTRFININESSSKAESSISLFPNPTKDVVNFYSPASGTAYLYNVSGKLITSQKISKGRTTIDSNDFPRGVYFITIATKNSVLKGNFVKL